MFELNDPYSPACLGAIIATHAGKCFALHAILRPVVALFSSQYFAVATLWLRLCGQSPCTVETKGDHKCSYDYNRKDGEAAQVHHPMLPSLRPLRPGFLVFCFHSQTTTTFGGTARMEVKGKARRNCRRRVAESLEATRRRRRAERSVRCARSVLSLFLFRAKRKRTDILLPFRVCICYADAGRKLVNIHKLCNNDYMSVTSKEDLLRGSTTVSLGTTVAGDVDRGSEMRKAIDFIRGKKKGHGDLLQSYLNAGQLGYSILQALDGTLNQAGMSFSDVLDLDEKGLQTALSDAETLMLAQQSGEKSMVSLARKAIADRVRDAMG